MYFRLHVSHLIHHLSLHLNHFAALIQEKLILWFSRIEIWVFVRLNLLAGEIVVLVRFDEFTRRRFVWHLRNVNAGAFILFLDIFFKYRSWFLRINIWIQNSLFLNVAVKTSFGSNHFLHVWCSSLMLSSRFYSHLLIRHLHWLPIQSIIWICVLLRNDDIVWLCYKVFWLWNVNIRLEHLFILIVFISIGVGNVLLTFFAVLSDDLGVILVHLKMWIDESCPISDSF